MVLNSEEIVALSFAISVSEASSSCVVAGSDFFGQFASGNLSVEEESAEVDYDENADVSFDETVLQGRDAGERGIALARQRCCVRL